MARLTSIGSDDDFPDVTEILGSRKVGAVPMAGRKDLQKSRGTEIRQKAAEASNSMARSLEGDSSGEEEELPRPKPRRRILNKKCDNPLLRPLQQTQAKAASEKFLKTQNPVPPSGDEREPAEATLPKVQMPRKLQNHSRVKALRQRSAKESRAMIHEDIFSEDEDKISECEDSSGMSDFIVDDDESLEEHSELEIATPPPKSARKLVRGRRPGEEDPGDKEKPYEDLFSLKQPLKEKEISDSRQDVPKYGGGDGGMGTKTFQPKTDRGSRDKGNVDIFVELESPFSRLTLSTSEDKNATQESKTTRFTTPPPSPRKLQKGLASPAKLPRIPQTPHRQSMDEFWKQDIINDWNDEYSPKKTIRAQEVMEERDTDLNEPAISLKKKVPKIDKSLQQSKKTFLQRRNQIAESFLAELDGEITNGQVSNLAESTGGIKIKWSKTLNTTAGRANWKMNTVKSTEEGKITTLYRHYAVIELAEKVIDDEHRLLNVVAHEFCHLANFMVSGIKNSPHGKEFKAWAAKCTAEFGHRGIEVTTKHSYEIDFKYHWKCGGCGHLYKRHSKSIDPAKVRCGNCKGVLAQIRPALKANAGNANGYQAFMKENMRRIKEENPGSPHKEIMSLVAKRYQESKASKMKEVVQGDDHLQQSSAGTSANSGDAMPDESEIDAVVRKLDFVDLTSP